MPIRNLQLKNIFLWMIFFFFHFSFPYSFSLFFFSAQLIKNKNKIPSTAIISCNPLGARSVKKKCGKKNYNFHLTQFWERKEKINFRGLNIPPLNYATPLHLLCVNSTRACYPIWRGKTYGMQLSRPIPWAPGAHAL